LKQFLIDSKDIEDFWIKNLVITDCNMSDDDFAEVLKGLYLQGCHIQQISYCRNEFGPKSLTALEELMPNLIDI